jgi:RNA polymerase sigma-70 factor (ECF subfamily)
LVQETYLRLCRNNCRALRDFRPEHDASFFGYLKNTASSVACDYFRAQGAVRRGPEPTTLDESSERHAIQSVPSAETKLIQAEIWRRLESIAENPQDVAIFRLHHLQGFTAREIAALSILRLSEKGVESRLRRLFKRLQKAMKSPPPNEGKAPDMPLGDIG